MVHLLKLQFLDNMQEQLDGFEELDEIKVELDEISVCEGQTCVNAANSRRSYQLPSAREISAVRHSLVPDMLSGWIPKKGVVCPVPLDFQNAVTNCIIDSLTKGQHPDKVVYLGPRHHNTYSAHAAFSSSYPFKYSHVEKQAHMLAYFRGFYANFKPTSNLPFIGNNPELAEQTLYFDSNFQSGNLDAAIKTEPCTYELYIRIDSNTNGHCLWYYFKTKSMCKQKVTFTICNLKRTAILYSEGHMSPYYCSSLEKVWKQLKKSNCISKGIKYIWLRNRFPREKITHLNLAFEYDYEQNEQVEFAYCIPYTYSQLLQTITQIKQSAHKNNVAFKWSTLCESLSGLDIPILSFGRGKKCILISARTHPGESNGSWKMEQILRELSTSRYHRLLEETVVKVVPMLNPDGVVLGNFRSSCAGRDLNRCFCEERLVAFPEVEGLKRLVINLREEFKDKAIMFLDLHGHSGKKNVFLYGFDNIGSLQARVFPKILSKKTDMFRYYACNFKLTREKKTTARACFMPYFKICFTIESSVSCYFAGGKTIVFDIAGWREMGQHILESVIDYLQISDLKTILRKGSVNRTLKAVKPLRRISTFKRSIKTQKDSKEEEKQRDNEKVALDKYLDLFKQIKEQEANKFQEAAEETDSQEDDYSKEYQQIFIQRMIDVRSNFQEAYRNRSLQNKSPSFIYNQYYQKKLVDAPRKRVLSIRQLTDPAVNQQYTSSFVQTSKKSKFRHSFYERKVKNTRKMSESDQPGQSFVSNFLQTPSQNTLKKEFNPKKLVQMNYEPALTFNLRLLAPENYVRPEQPQNNRKAYVGKQYLSRLRLRNNQSVH